MTVRFSPNLARAVADELERHSAELGINRNVDVECALVRRIVIGVKSDGKMGPQHRKRRFGPVVLGIPRIVTVPDLLVNAGGDIPNRIADCCHRRRPDLRDPARRKGSEVGAEPDGHHA